LNCWSERSVRLIADVIDRYKAAIQSFFDVQDAQAAKQKAAGKSDAGRRSRVTGGAHLDAVTDLVQEIVIDSGAQREHIHVKTRLELPGYYRAEKRWDVLVMMDQQLVAAIEFKAICSSFGNNLNNRSEEALGNSEDLWTAYREGRFGRGAFQPLLGYLLILEDSREVHTPVTTREPHFELDPVFRGASYAQRAEWLIRRLILERKYQAACLTLATNTKPTRISHPAEDLTFLRFATALEGHIRTFVQMRGAR
jgi:hypothetical protein